MKKVTSFEAASLATGTLIVKKPGPGPDDPEIQEEYTLAMDFKAIAKALEHTGRDLVAFPNWEGMKGPEIYTVCWCAMSRFHPAVSLEAVQEMIPPAHAIHVANMLLELCFPGVTEEMAKIREMMKSMKTGEQPPNPPGSPATVIQ